MHPPTPRLRWTGALGFLVAGRFAGAVVRPRPAWTGFPFSYALVVAAAREDCKNKIRFVDVFGKCKINSDKMR
jgi:hypothetical protein